MSLSEQIGRVDGSQNDILKTILKAFGVTIGTEKIDAIADLAEAASNLQDDGILSTATKTAFGLDSSASPDDALAILANAAILKDGNLQLPNGGSIPRVVVEAGNYVGTGQYGAGHPNILQYNFIPYIVFVSGLSNSSIAGASIFVKDCPSAPAVIGNAQYYWCSLAWSNNQVSWYSVEGADFQGNTANKTFYTLAIGFKE